MAEIAKNDEKRVFKKQKGIKRVDDEMTKTDFTLINRTLKV